MTKKMDHNQELTTNQVVNSIINNDLVSARSDTIDILNNIANQYLDIHKTEVGKMMFQNEEIMPEKDEEYVQSRWWQVRKGIKDQPQSKDHANAQLKGRVGKMTEDIIPLLDEDKTIHIAVDDIDSIDDVLEKFDHDIIDEKTIAIHQKDYNKFKKALVKAGHAI